MLKVYKYPVETKRLFKINMPQGARVLKVENQRGIPCLWALVNPDAVLFPRYFLLAATGQDIEYDAEDLEFISTFQVDGGTFIFHIFEIIKK